MNSPVISLIMSVYNGEKYIARALMSLLAQTFDNFEVILVDDGSTDATANIVRSIRDGRIKYIEQSNSGLTKSLNKALSIATGKWIARHDADDFSISTRFERQLAFLNKNPNIGLLGSSCFIQPERIGMINEIYMYPERYEEILAVFTTYNPFVHGSMLIDRELLLASGGYNEQYRYVQDYELWSRIILKTQAYNLKTPLYVRSIHQSASQVQIRKEPIFEEINNKFKELNADCYSPNACCFKEIGSISLYPAVTLRESWNKSIRYSYYRMSVESRKQGLPWLRMWLQSLIYYPWSVSAKAA